MSLPLTQAPQQLCILRLSAVGDISHTLPVIRTLQQHWPDTRLTWIIGKTELGLVYDIPDIEFIPLDKRAGWRGYLALRRQLKQRRFEVLLHMQMSLRASLIASWVNAPIKLGFDKQRAKDLQWLFTTHKIPYTSKQHVIDSFFGFSQALGIESRLYQWDIPIPEAARRFAEQHLPAQPPALVISPCSSMDYRNWNADAYAAVAQHAQTQLGMTVVLTGGTRTIERQYGDRITSACSVPVIDLIGQTDLKQLLAVLARARVVITPDAGSAHLANAVGTPVIGLYATTNPERARPYCWPQYVVNRYPEAIHAKFGKPVDEVAWGTRVRDHGTMDRIKIDDVIGMLNTVLHNPPSTV